MRTEDGDIIHKCLTGDTAAFGLLVDKYKASVYALAYAKLGNFHDAQDITQEVFLKAYQKLRTLKHWDKFLSWLYAITSNMCKDFLRAKAKRPDSEYIADQDTARLEQRSLASHHENEVYQSLHETLAMLPEIHRQVLTLHYLGGMSCREIGQFLGVSPHAIAMRLNRARSKLKKEMLTLMDTHFAQQKLNPAFTFNIVEVIKRTRIQPNPQTPLIPVGFAALSLLALTLLCLTVPFDQFPAIGNMVGAPIPSETEVTEVGEIPVAEVVLAETAIVSSGDGKKDLARNPQPTDIVLAANAETEVETAIKPTTRLGKGRVHRIAYSPDGKLIAMMGALGIWLYDAETLTEVGMIPKGANAIAFSPDGGTLASGSWSDTVHLWEVSTQKRVGRLMSPRQRSVTTLAFTPDGNTLAVGYGKGDIVLWDMSTQQQTALLDTPSSSVSILAFSPDGKLLASGGSEDLTISLWDVQTQTLVGAFEAHTHVGTFEGHGHKVRSVAFSPDGKILASGIHGHDIVFLWDVATRSRIALLANNINKKYKGVNSVAFSPDGTILASTGNDGKIWLWDARTKRRIGVLKTNADGVTSIVFRPDGKTLASLNGQFGDSEFKGGDMAVRLWNVKTRKQTAVLEDHTAGIESVALSPDGTLLASGHHDGLVRLWDIQTQKQLATLKGHKAVVESVAFSLDGTLLASGGKDRARLWNVRKRKQIRTFKHKAIVESVAFSPDGRTLAAVDYNCIRLWDVRRNRAVGVLGPDPPHRGPFTLSIIRSVAFSPDGTLLASGGIDNTVRLWNVQNRQEIFRHERAQQGDILTVAFSPDGKTFASAGTGKGIYLWRVVEQELIMTLNQEWITALAFSPEGRFLAAGTGAEIRVWDMETQTEVTTLEGCASRVTSIAFSSDGKKVVAGSLDGTIRIWDTAGFAGN